MKFILLFSIFLSFLHVNAQNFKPFEGELMYSIELIHPETKKPKFISFTTIFTNDTLVRTDSENLSLGKQTLIRHLQLSKQYVLLEYKGKKYKTKVITMIENGPPIDWNEEIWIPAQIPIIYPRVIV
jgi:hypothetical protein